VIMRRAPIGVWFSIAIILLILNFWVGTMIGSVVARHLYGHPQVVERFSGSERTRVQAELLDVDLAQAVQLASKVPAREESLLKEIATLETIRRAPSAKDIEFPIDLVLGIAYVQASMTEEQSNMELARKNMESAQALFKSLGWRDYSEETLKTVANRVRANPPAKATFK